MEVSNSLPIGGLTFKYASGFSPQLGLIVSKQYGNSVARNLFKRRCRSLFRIWFINRGLQIVLIVRPTKKNIPFKNMNNNFRALCEKICT